MFFNGAFYRTNHLTDFYLTTFASLIKNVGSLRKNIYFLVGIKTCEISKS